MTLHRGDGKAARGKGVCIVVHCRYFIIADSISIRNNLHFWGNPRHERVQQYGYRPVVAERHLHMRAETPCFDMNPVSA